MTRVIASKLQRVIDQSPHKAKSDRQLAKEVGVSHVLIWKLRTGWKDKNGQPYNPTLAMLDRLCGFFKCQVGDILEHRKK